jgi:uncharacterized protein
LYRLYNMNILKMSQMLTSKTATFQRRSYLGIFWFNGIVSGVLMGLFGIGALLAAGIDRYAENRSDYRGNLCFVFIVDNVFRCIGYGWRGILSWQIIRFSLLLFPAAILGMWLSTKIDMRLSEEQIRKAILVLLVTSGVFLIINNAHI